VISTSCDAPSAPTGANSGALHVIFKEVLLTVGQSQQLAVVGATAPVRWASDNPAVATVTASGLISANSPGSARVVAQGQGTADTSLVTVRAGTPVTLVADSIVLPLAHPTRLSFSTAASPGDGASAQARAKWSSSAPSIATVDATGLVTGVMIGNAAIVVSLDGATDTTYVRIDSVTVAAISIQASSKQLVLSQYETRTLGAVARDASGNQLHDRFVTWSSSSPGVATITASGSVTAIAPGTATVTASSEGKSDSVVVTVPAETPTPLPTGATDAELPRVYLNTAVANTPSAGKVWHVPADANLQAVIDSAAPGDRIALAAGARYVGNFVVSPKSGGIAGGWLTITTEGCSTLPPEGVRVTVAAASCYAKLVSNFVLPSLATAGPVTKLRVIGVEFTPDPSQSVSQAIVQLGSSGSDQNTLALTPTDIILDRVYVHGNAAVDDRKCVTLNVARGAVIDSRIEQCHSAFDSQAITLTNGPGPFKIVNNYLDAAAENIAIGGAPVWIPAIPSDFEIRHNYFYKDPANHGVWQTKNIIEFKVGARVLIDGNVLENSWVDAQAGYAFVLWDANAGCGTCEAKDFTITNNLIRNVAGGWSLVSRYDATSGAGLRNVTIRNNVIIGLNQSTGNGRVFSLNDTIPNVVIEHNTGIGTPDGGVVVGASNGSPVPYHQVIRNNLLGGSYFSGFGMGSKAWSLFADATSINTNNVYEKASDWFNTIAGNWYPQTDDALGLAGGATAATSVTATPDQMALAASSAYKGKGTDGRDLGFDLASLLAAIQGVAP
jgi:uncharacterized protein YjdB